MEIINDNTPEEDKKKEGTEDVEMLGCVGNREGEDGWGS